MSSLDQVLNEIFLMIADDLSLDDLIALSLCNKTFYNALVEFRTKLNKSRQILSDYYREHFRQLQLSPDQRKQPIHPVETLCESVSDNNKTSKLKELEDLIKAGLDLDKRIVPVVLGVNHTIPRSGVSQTSVKIILKGFPISVGVLELLVARGAKIESDQQNVSQHITRKFTEYIQSTKSGNRATEEEHVKRDAEQYEVWGATEGVGRRKKKMRRLQGETIVYLFTIAVF
ncbi:hypothetical protein FPQ18DRAFT_387197 [Pyronema domesticum]|nr:hypothetical protein FPQ18DRAFT_387197 [Pyronema domesticum]